MLESELDDSFDAYAGARAWCCYALEAVPPPHPTAPGWTPRLRLNAPALSLSESDPPAPSSKSARYRQASGSPARQ